MWYILYFHQSPEYYQALIVAIFQNSNENSLLSEDYLHGNALGWQMCYVWCEKVSLNIHHNWLWFNCLCYEKPVEWTVLNMWEFYRFTKNCFLFWALVCGSIDIGNMFVTCLNIFVANAHAQTYVYDWRQLNRLMSIGQFWLISFRFVVFVFKRIFKSNRWKIPFHLISNQ